MSGFTCKHCKFSGVLLNSQKEMIPVCRRNPPVVKATLVPTKDGNAKWLTTTAWPLITDDDWCGDFEPKLNA